MGKFAHVSKLIRDEQSAQKDYSSAAKKFPGSASTFHHIRSDEAHHEKELKRVKQKADN